MEITTNNLTMSSRDISALTQKRHDSVMRTIESLNMKGLLESPQFVETQHDQNKQMYTIANLGKTDSLVLIARLSPEFTKAVVDRWQHLEDSQKPKLPQSFAEALQLAANQAKMLEEAAPKVEFHDKLVNDAATFSFRDAAKKIQQRPNKFTEWLRLEGYICKNNMPKQQYINQGLFKTHTGTSKEEFQFSQTRVTSKGLSYFTTKLGEVKL